MSENRPELGFKSLFTKKHVVAITLVLLAAAAVIIAAAAIRRVGNGSEKSWDGCEFTKGIPAFPDEPKAFEISEHAAAAYYTGVTGAQIEEYVKTLGAECGARFDSSEYPRAAVLGERTIILHYNVTEKNFSVTVAKDFAETNGESGRDENQ